MLKKKKRNKIHWNILPQQNRNKHNQRRGSLWYLTLRNCKGVKNVWKYFTYFLNTRKMPLTVIFNCIEKTEKKLASSLHCVPAKYCNWISCMPNAGFSNCCKCIRPCNFSWNVTKPMDRVTRPDSFFFFRSSQLKENLKKQKFW